MDIGAVIIGDELLSGKRQDKHLGFLIDTLTPRGLELRWVRMVGDHPQHLLETFHQTLATEAIVFCFGGIGATPDDLTRSTLAQAAGRALQRHPEAQALLEARFGEAAYPHRIRMAHLPVGATLIPNPVNQVPGFSLQQHHCVPGFPNMAWPMVEWVLDTYYVHLYTSPDTEMLFTVQGAAESDLIPLMEALTARFPQLRLSSLPSGERGRFLEIGLKGPEPTLLPACEQLRAGLQAQSLSFSEQPRIPTARSTPET